MGHPNVNIQHAGALVTIDNPLPVTPGILAPSSSFPGYSLYRNTALLATKAAVKAAAGNIYGLRLLNPNTVPVYVKIWNKLIADVTVGTTVPQHVIEIPAGDGLNSGQFVVTPEGLPAYGFDTGIVIAAVTGLADASTTAPSTAINVEAQYK